MEQFERIRKIGKGNFGDVLLVQRKSDGKVYILFIK
jgi:NIMA (never in mitosis gene a)-related kinase